MLSHPWLTFLALWAAAIMGFSKTALPAASILAVVLMAAAFPDNAKQSVGVMLPVLLVGDVFAVWWFHRHAQWGRLLGLAPYVLLGMVPGFLVLVWVDNNGYRPWIGWLVLGMVLLEAVRRGLALKEVPDRWWFTGTFGALAGFGTMVANAGGPVMNLYLLSRKMFKEQFVGTCAWFFFLINLSKVVPFWNRGMISAETISYGLGMAPFTLLGGLAGIWLLPRLSQRTFDLLAWTLSAAMAVWLIVG